MTAKENNKFKRNAEFSKVLLVCLFVCCWPVLSPERIAGAQTQETPAAAAAAAGNVTLDFKDADIRNVLKIISYKSGMNIVTTPDVMGNVTIRLTEVPWERALDVILQTYGYGYEKKANIISWRR